MFPKLDVSPTDGFVTESELTEWNMQSSAKEVMHRTQRDMDVHDRNKDGFISFSEYEPPSWVRNAGEAAASCFFSVHRMFGTYYVHEGLTRFW